MKRWPTKPLRELCSVVNERAAEGETPYLEIGNLDPRTKEYVFSEKPAVKGALATQADDLIISRVRPTRGAITLLHDKRQVVSSAFTVLRSRQDIRARFLFFALAWNDAFLTYLGRQSKGALYPTVPEKDVLAFEIPVPPLVEQERIAKLLDEANELRKLRIQADRRTAAFIPALFHEMFGDPTSSGNRWPIAPLGNMGKVTTGNTPSRNNPEYFGNFVEWIKTDNIDAIRRIITKAAEGLSEKGAAIGRVVPSGTILITCIAGSRDRLGDAAVTDRQVAINQQINALTPNRDIDSYFLCQMVGALKKVIQHRATGVMTGIINKSTLESIPAICPPLPLQQEFAKRVSEIRELESGQAASRRRLDALFQSLFHRAFQGEL